MSTHFKELEVEKRLAPGRQNLQFSVNIGGLGAGLRLMPELGGNEADKVERVLIHCEGRLFRHSVMLHCVARKNKEEDSFQVLYSLQRSVRLLKGKKKKIDKHDQANSGRC